MPRVIHTLLWLLWVGAASATDSRRLDFCATEVAIAIDRVQSRIHIRGDEEKYRNIEVLLPVDCLSGEDLEPTSLREAVRWLDSALPVDYKTGLLKGNTYQHSPYGASVDSELAHFFQEKWSLTKGSQICADAWEGAKANSDISDEDIREAEFCGPDLILHLRRALLGRHCGILEGNLGLTQKSGCVPTVGRHASDSEKVSGTLSRVGGKGDEQLPLGESFVAAMERIRLCAAAWNGLLNDWKQNGGGILASMAATREQVAKDQQSAFARVVREAWGVQNRSAPGSIGNWPIADDLYREVVYSVDARGLVPEACEPPIWLDDWLFFEIVTNQEKLAVRRLPEMPAGLDASDHHSATSWLFYWLFARVDDVPKSGDGGG